jgi:electron transfer flavoprotein alpha/beta subunit
MEGKLDQDERLRVALTGGLERQAHVREAVSHGPDRAIKIGRGKSDRGNRRLRATPLLSAAVRSPEWR